MPPPETNPPPVSNPPPGKQPTQPTQPTTGTDPQRPPAQSPDSSDLPFSGSVGGGCVCATGPSGNASTSAMLLAGLVLTVGMRRRRRRTR
jgi:MYXO-CTERM domain-containing protein